MTFTAAALARGMSGIDYRAAVGDEWRRLDVGRTLDTEVDKAFESVKDEQSWGSLLQSLAAKTRRANSQSRSPSASIARPPCKRRLKIWRPASAVGLADA